MNRLPLSSLLAALALAWCSCAGAADIYKWVDKDGRTQLSDKVPEEYKDKAVKVDRAPEPTAEEKRAAEGRAARDRSAAGIGSVAAPVVPASAASGPTASAKPAGDSCS